MSDPTTKAGWGFPGSARKAHYFVDTMALCGKWGFYRGDLQPDDGPSRDDCVACRRALTTLTQTEGPTTDV